LSGQQKIDSNVGQAGTAERFGDWWGLRETTWGVRGHAPPQENFEIQASKMHGHNASKFNGYQKIVDTFLCLNYLILAKHLYRTQLKYIQN
jgi:hypothetical protein